jgi:hypothetical protein
VPPLVRRLIIITWDNGATRRAGLSLSPCRAYRDELTDVRGASMRGQHVAPTESDPVIGVIILALLVLLTAVVALAMV